MDGSSGAAGPRVIDVCPAGFPAGRIISGCDDPAAALTMVTSTSSMVVFVGDELVMGLHRAFVERVADLAAVPVRSIPIPRGEQAKSFAVLESACRSLAVMNADRNCVIVGFGGGVSTDLAAMLASVWMRGVRLIHVPTSLLAMADAAVGGKAAVNISEGRNLAGCLKFPEYVFVDGSFLATLPDVEVVSGLVEIVKTGFVAGPDLVRSLAECTDYRDSLTLGRLAADAAAIKADLVSRDPRDHGVRLLLNFGHTVAHAIESASLYSVGHGQAVAAGMRAESAVAVRYGLWTPGERRALIAQLDRIGVVSAPSVDFDAALPFLVRDKKNEAGQVMLALPGNPGTAGIPQDFRLVPVATQIVRECWND